MSRIKELRLAKGISMKDTARMLDKERRCFL